MTDRPIPLLDGVLPMVTNQTLTILRVPRSQNNHILLLDLPRDMDLCEGLGIHQSSLMILEHLGRNFVFHWRVNHLQRSPDYPYCVPHAIETWKHSLNSRNTLFDTKSHLNVMSLTALEQTGFPPLMTLIDTKSQDILNIMLNPRMSGDTAAQSLVVDQKIRHGID